MESFLKKLSKSCALKVFDKNDTIKEEITQWWQDSVEEVSYTYDDTQDELKSLEANAILANEVRSFILKRKGRMNFAVYATLPRCSFMPALVTSLTSTEDDDTALSKRFNMKLLYLGRLTARDQMLSSAVQEGRRVTQSNIVKWVQQLFTTLGAMHKCFVTTGGFDCDQVILRSDEGGLFNALFHLEDTPATALRPHGKDKVVGCTIVKSKTSSKEEKENNEWEEFGRHAWLDVIKIRSFVDLRLIGKDLQCKIETTIAEKISEIKQTYDDFIDSVCKDWRSLGLIILELLFHRRLSSAERKFWMTFHSELFPVGWEDIYLPNNSRRPDAASLPKTLNDRVKLCIYKLGDVNKKMLRLLSMVEATLADQVQEILTYPVVLRQILSICFMPRLPVREEEGKNRCQLSYPLWSACQSILKEAKDFILQYYEDCHYTKPTYWTAEDEKKRLLARKERSEMLQEKAEEGVLAAKQRILKAKYQVWWDLQSTTYRQRLERQRKLRIEAEKRRRESKKFLKAALFHSWSSDELQKWLQLALASYFHILAYFHAYAISLNPKKPQVYVSRLLEELTSLLDDFIIEKVHTRYNIANEEVREKILNAFPQLLHMPTNTSRGERAGNGMGAAGSSKSTEKTAPIRSINTTNKLLPVPANLILSNGKSDLEVDMDDTITIQQIMSVGLDNNNNSNSLNLCIALPRRTVAAMKLIAYHLPSYLIDLYYDSQMLSKTIRASLRAGQNTVQARLNKQKAVFLSPQQLHFKQLQQQRLEVIHLSPQFRKAVWAFYDNLQIMDRGRGQQLVNIFSAAVLHQYISETEVRRKGEDIAAHILVSFFRMVRVQRKLLPLLRAEVKELRYHSYEIKKSHQRADSMKNLMDLIGKKAAASLGIKLPSLSSQPRTPSSRALSRQKSSREAKEGGGEDDGAKGKEEKEAIKLLRWQIEVVSSGCVRVIWSVLLSASFDEEEEVLAAHGQKTLKDLATTAFLLDHPSSDNSHSSSICVFFQSKQRSILYDPVALFPQRFSRSENDGRAAEGYVLPCSLHLAVEKENELTWQVEIFGLLPNHKYEIIAELDTDLNEALRNVMRESLKQEGGMVEQQVSVSLSDRISSWPILPRALINTTGGLAFSTRACIKTKPSRPISPSPVVAGVRYSSGLSATLVSELRPSSKPLPYSQKSRPDRTAAPPSLPSQIAFYLSCSPVGLVDEFSSLLQVSWPASIEDRASLTTYSLRRRMILLMEQSLFEQQQEEMSSPAATKNAPMLTYSCLDEMGRWLAFAYRGQWVEVKEKSRAAEAVDHVSSLSEEVAVTMTSPLKTLLCQLFTSLVTRATVLRDGEGREQIRTGIYLFVQYAVQTTNSQGSSPFSTTALGTIFTKEKASKLEGRHCQGLQGAGLGLCELAEVVISKDCLLAVAGAQQKLLLSHSLLPVFMLSTLEEEEEKDGVALQEGEDDVHLTSGGGGGENDLLEEEEVENNKEVDAWLQRVVAASPLLTFSQNSLFV